jgi:rubrerythrin
MANLFLASEILEMNVSEERNGAAFYQALSESAKSKTLRKAAAEIAEQEKAHEIRFAQLLDQVEGREPEESYPGEFDAYIQSLMRNKMFSSEDAARTMAQNQNDVDAVKFALKTEQATLNLLKELKKHMAEKEMAVIDLTIEEENDHVKQLNQLLLELAK